MVYNFVLTAILSTAILITSSYGINILYKTKNANNNFWWSSFGIILGYYYVINIPRQLLNFLQYFFNEQSTQQPQPSYVYEPAYLYRFTTLTQQHLILFMSIYCQRIASQKAVTNSHFMCLFIILYGLISSFLIKTKFLLSICVLIYDFAAFSFSLVAVITVFCFKTKISQINLAVTKFAWIPLFMSISFAANFALPIFDFLEEIGLLSMNISDKSHFVQCVNDIIETVTLFGSFGIFLYLRNTGNTSSNSLDSGNSLL